MRRGNLCCPTFQLLSPFPILRLRLKGVGKLLLCGDALSVSQMQVALRHLLRFLDAVLLLLSLQQLSRDLAKELVDPEGVVVKLAIVSPGSSSPVVQGKGQFGVTLRSLLLLLEPPPFPSMMCVEVACPPLEMLCISSRRLISMVNLWR